VGSADTLISPAFVGLFIYDLAPILCVI